MTMQSTEAMLVIYIVIFVGSLLAFEGLRQLLSRSENTSEIRNRRMRLVKSGATSEDVLSQLIYAEKPSGRGFSLIPDVGRTLRQAGLPISPVLFYLMSLLLGAGVFLAVQNLVAANFALPAALVAAIGLPGFLLNTLKKQRMDKLVAQLPDALDQMARGLKVGHPLNVTVASVAREMSDPIGTEFGLIGDQVSFGDDIVGAFRDFADRVDLEDARYLSVSIGIQHGTGGNLGRVLSVLSKVIRDRATMRRKIKAISSEGRLSAMILSILPFGIFGSIQLTSPTFYGDVQSDPLFMPVAVAIISLVVLQALILRRLVTFKF